MLRVTVHDRPEELRLHLEGRLAGDWVPEVARCWHVVRGALRRKTAIVDLRDVDFVDSGGEDLLATMHQQGARLLANGAMTQSLISKITGGEAVAHPNVRPR